MSSLNSTPSFRGSEPQSPRAYEDDSDLLAEEALSTRFNNLHLNQIRDVLRPHGAIAVEETQRISAETRPDEFPELDTIDRGIGLGAIPATSAPTQYTPIITRSTRALSHRTVDTTASLTSSDMNIVTLVQEPQIAPPARPGQHDSESGSDADSNTLPPMPPAPHAQSTGAQPDPQPIDFTVGEASAALENQFESVNTNRLPTVESIIGRNAGAAALTDSGVLDDLNAFDPDSIISAGPYRLITGHTRQIVDVHTQIMFAIAARYYSTVPTAQYDELTAHFLHYLYTIARGPPGQLAAYEPVYERYRWVTEEGLEHFFTELARILIPDHGPESTGLGNLLTPVDFNSLLHELQTSYSEVTVCYNAAYQLVQGGLRCIQPIPPLLKNDTNLSMYINAIARGYDRVRATHVVWGTRPINLPTVRQRIQAAVPIDAAPPIRQEENRPPPHIPGVSSRGIGATPRAGYPNRPSQLLPQGAPSPVHVERNTTEFRSSVDHLQGVIRRVEVVEQAVRVLQGEMTEMRSDIRTVRDEFNNMNRDLAGHLQRYAQGDLQGRSTVNRTVLQAASPVAQAMMTSQPPLQGMPVNRYNDLIARIEGITPSTDLESLTNDIRTVLMDAGETNIANQLIPASLQYEMARKRIITRIRACNVRY